MCGLFPFFPAPDAHHPLCTILFCLPETELGSDVVWPAQAQNGEMTRVQTHTRRISFGTGVEAASMTFGRCFLLVQKKAGVARSRWCGLLVCAVGRPSGRSTRPSRDCSAPCVGGGNRRRPVGAVAWLGCGCGANTWCCPRLGLVGRLALGPSWPRLVRWIVGLAHQMAASGSACCPDVCHAGRSSMSSSSPCAKVGRFSRRRWRQRRRRQTLLRQRHDRSRITQYLFRLV